jgi:hypothetical protein
VDAERARELPQLLVVGVSDAVPSDRLLKVSELVEGCPGEP